MATNLETPFVSFRSALDHVISKGMTTYAECAIAGECDERTIRNYCDGATNPSDEIAHRISRMHKNPDVQRILRKARDSGYPCEQQIATDLNGDGITDVRDLQLSEAELVRLAAEENASVAKMNSFGAEDVQQLVRGASRIKHWADVIGCIAGRVFRNGHTGATRQNGRN